jgi:hypothetical protein
MKKSLVESNTVVFRDASLPGYELRSRDTELTVTRVGSSELAVAE